MAKASASEIHFSQSVKKKKTGLNHWVLEFPYHKVQWRKCAHLQQQPPLGTSFEQRTAPSLGIGGD